MIDSSPVGSGVGVLRRVGLLAGLRDAGGIGGGLVRVGCGGLGVRVGVGVGIRCGGLGVVVSFGRRGLGVVRVGVGIGRGLVGVRGLLAGGGRGLPVGGGGGLGVGGNGSAPTGRLTTVPGRLVVAPDGLSSAVVPL